MIHNGSIQWSGTVKEMEKSSDPYLNQFLRGDAEGPIEAIR
jgi:phospholipid/cholesterol/gamma-HCH transport system ATP-binding protein